MMYRVHSAHGMIESVLSKEHATAIAEQMCAEYGPGSHWLEPAGGLCNVCASLSDVLLHGKCEPCVDASGFYPKMVQKACRMCAGRGLEITPTELWEEMEAYRSHIFKLTGIWDRIPRFIWRIISEPNQLVMFCEEQLQQREVSS